MFTFLGSVCRDKGDLKHPSDYYQNAVKIQKEKSGENNAAVPGSYHNLGSVCPDKGDFD